jgi:cation transport ATPase
MAERKTRKRRGARPQAQSEAAQPTPSDKIAADGPMGRGYARSRQRNEAARAALEPLRPGERPRAVTIGAIAAAVLALANLVALGLGYNAGEDTLSPGSDATGSILAAVVLMVVAYGMWKGHYWGVLGMQTLLALTLVFASLGLVTASSLWAAGLLVIIIAAAGTLFWFLVKAMARIQMPERPGSQRSGR